MKPCLLVPHYDHVPQFRQLLPKLTQTRLPLLVVDDASPQPTFDELRALLDEAGGDVTLLRHEHNLGKGGAVTTGLRAAHQAGYSHALQVDADGQHDIGSLDDFLAAGQEHPDAIICGEPQFDESISPVRYYGRYLTHSLVWLETLSFDIRDAMCGFRLYPLESMVQLLDRVKIGSRMAFDPEILVRASWAGVPTRFVPVRVHYPEGGASHFHYLRDNALITWMHTRLIAGMLVRSPCLILRRVGKPGS